VLIEYISSVSRRFGTPIREIRSNNEGTNFVGADNELKRAYKEMDDLLKHNIYWRRNPPAASHHS
jgi:hypothetical protein